MTEPDFADVIAADYGSDAPRMVFADWLIERGEERRAELIRIQCTLARAENQPRTEELNRLFSRQTQLQPVMTAMLTAAQSGLPRYVGLRFERGLIQNVEVDAAVFAGEAALIAQRVPFFMKLMLRGGVAVAPELARVRSLRVDGDPTAAELERVLAVAPLYALDLRAEKVEDDVVAMLAERASGVRELTLTTISHTAATTLASVRFAALERLVLYRIGGARGAKALVGAAWADRIQDLVIHKGALTEAAADALHARFGARFRTYPIAT